MTERVLSEVVELDLDKCTLSYGVSPCTAGIKDSGTAQAGASTTLTLRAAASAVDDFYNGMTARLLTGSGSVQERKISDYVGATKVATLEKRWRTNLVTHSDLKTGVSYSFLTGNVTDDGIDAGAVGPNGESGVRKWTVTGTTNTNRWGDLVSGTATVTYGGSIYIRRADGGSGNVTIDVNDMGAKTVTVTPQWQRLDTTGAHATQPYRFVDLSSMAVGAYHLMHVQLEQATDLGDYVQSSGSIVDLPNATSTYTVIDRPNACYNTFRTCQDKANYTKGTQTLRFTGLGAPIDKAAPARPYIARLTTAPTELDLEEAISRRASSSVVLVDDTDADVELDPYVRDRATVARGTFWTRFFARHLNYAGRAARVKRAFVDRGVFGAYTTERFIIEAAKGPDARGEVTLSLKDPIKLLDRAKAPTPTSGKLALDFGLNDLTFTLDGTASQYAASGWVRIGDEVVRYASKSGEVFTLADGTYRANFGSTASAHQIGDGVQQCLVYQNQTLAQIAEDLHNRGGILDADLDLAGLQAEYDTWLGADFLIAQVCITDPEDITVLLKELLAPANMTTWWSPTEQKVKFKVYAPASPAAIVVTVLDDTQELMDQSVATERLEALRITFGAVNFGLRTAVDNPEEAKSYQQGELAVDLDAESANEYNERRVLTINSRFYGAGNTRAMRTFIQRYVARHRDAPERIEFGLDPKDGSLKEGEICDLQTFRLVEADGTTRTARVLIVRREPRGVDVKYAARITNFDRPYGFIAPDGTPNYPNNNGYACVSQNDGRMTNGDPGFLII